MKTKDDLHINASVKIFEKAKDLRRKMTDAEKRLWTVLRVGKMFPYKFRRQHPILGYILDFYCHELKLAIELDGEMHERWDHKDYDSYRSNELLEYGIKVIRFKNIEIFENINEVTNRIKLTIDNIKRSA